MDHFGNIPDLPEVSPPSPRPLPKCDPEYALARVDLLMGSYRKSDYHNVQTFIATLTEILAQYPPEIVEYVTDPKTGLQRRLKFPPTPAEVVEACAAEIAWRTKIARNSSLSPAPRLPPPLTSGVIGNGGPGTIYTAKAFDLAVAKHGRPTGVFERPGDEWSKRPIER
jgi:hypothetical protein